MPKETKKDISLINISIKLNTLALDSHPEDLKNGRSTSMRIIHLGYIDNGIVNVPAHKWMFGWLKEVFGKSKSRGTVVHLPHKIELYPIGDAKDILVGKSQSEWEIDGEKSVPHKLGDDIEKFKLYPFHEYVPTTKGSVTKYFYKINDKTKIIPMEIYTLIPAKVVEDNIRKLGGIYGLGPKASGYRIGTFEVVDMKSSKMAEIVV